jgi:hypothetical protein
MKLPQLSKKQWIIAVVILFIVLSFPEIYLFAPYFLIIKPSAEKDINEILSEIKTLNQTGKLQRLVEWETDGFTERFATEPNFHLHGILGGYGLYFNSSDRQPVKIRSNSIVFNGDPYWITYFKTGACSERATLFNFIANQSGEVTRIVSAPGDDHEWVEVNNGNEWIYADPTFYFHYHNSPGRENAWMGKTPILQESWGWHLCKVITKLNDTELTDKYSEVGNLSIIYHSSNRVYVNRFLSGEHRNVTLFSKQIKESSHKNMITYQLGLSNEYIIVAEKSNFPFPSKWIDEKVVFLDNESTTVILNPESGREDVDYMAIGAYAVCIVLYALIGYWIYRDRKKEKGQK